MTKARTPPAWRRPFLRELARSGSVRLAAEACGVDPTYPYQLRKRNAAFAASWDRAVARAREGLAAGPPQRPVLRASQMIRSSKTGKVCIMQVGPGRWSAAKEAVFLAELTATANVKAAARAAGVSTVVVYNRRKLWPAFAAQWQAAIAEGHARIETLLVCAATNTLDPEPLPERAWDAPEMSVEQALKLHLAHLPREHGGKRRLGGPPRRPPGIEEVRAEIMRKVAAIKRARGLAD